MSQPAPEGWYLIGFLDRIPQGVSPLQVGSRALLTIRDGDDVQVFDGRCPHRGAHLGHGGTLDRGCVVCPFHGKHIQLGAPEKRLGVARHEVLQAGPAVFLRLGGAEQDRGFPQAARLLAGFRVTAAVELEVSIPAPFIVENAFDVDHFRAVHKVPRVRGLHVGMGPSGELTVRTEFLTAMSPWERQAARMSAPGSTGTAGNTPDSAEGTRDVGSADSANQFLARAFSPNLVVTDFDDGTRHSFIITGAVPLGPRRTLARVAVAADPNTPAAVVTGMAGGARKALGEDVVVWEHLDVDGPERLDGRDAAVIAFRQFCATFPDFGVAATHPADDQRESA